MSLASSDLPTRGIGRFYLVPLMVTAPIGQLAIILTGSGPWAFGQSPAIILPLAGGFLSFLLWLGYRPFSHIPPTGRWPLLALLAVWATALMRSLVDASGYTYLIALVPILLLMVLWKAPTPGSIAVAAKGLSVAIVCSAVVAEMYSLASHAAPPATLSTGPTWVAELSGVTHRWVSPFLQENYAGPIGAYVAVFAITQRGWYRWSIAFLGTWMVLASKSSTALLGVLVGLAVLSIFATSGPLSRFSRGSRGIATAGVLLVLASVVALRAPTFNGRTTVWTSYLDVWQSNPLAGVGTSGIDSALRSGQIPLYWTHAHNVPLDLLVKYGVLGLTLILVVYALSAWGAFRAAQAGSSWPLAIVVMFIAMGLMEVPGDWITWNIPMLWLLLAILGSQVPRLPGVNGEVPSRR